MSQHRDGETSFYHFDALGSTRGLTDDTETVTDETAYEAFGKTAASTGSTEHPFQWVGKLGYYADAETELYSLRRRQYGADEGRFVSEDPINGKNGDRNLFRYTSNNPGNLVDPSGLQDDSQPENDDSWEALELLLQLERARTQVESLKLLGWMMTDLDDDEAVSKLEQAANQALSLVATLTKEYEEAAKRGPQLDLSPHTSRPTGDRQISRPPEDLLAAIEEEYIAQIEISRSAQDWWPVSFWLSNVRGAAAARQQRQFLEQLQNDVREQERTHQIASFWSNGKEWRDAIQDSGYDSFAVKRAQVQTFAPVEAGVAAGTAVAEPIAVRVPGVLHIVAGVGQGILAAESAAIPPVAVALAVSAADDIYTGFTILITGEAHRTLKSQFVGAVLESAGASPEDAALAGDLADLAFSLIVGVGAILARSSRIASAAGRVGSSAESANIGTRGAKNFVAPTTRGPIANSVFDTSGRRIGNFLDDPSILDQIASQRVVYVTDVAEKSALKQALRTNPFVQSSGRMPQVRFLHGYDGDVVSAASRQLVGSKRVSGHTTILNRQRIANRQVEVHVGRTHGPHVHINRGQADEIYIRLSDPNWHEAIPRRVLENQRVRDAIMRAAFYGLDFLESGNLIDERVTLKTNSQGHPVLVRCGDQKIEVLISEDSGAGVTDVEIIGDEAGLRRLGEILIGVSKAKGYHIHVEADPETSPLEIEPKNIRLTISNAETPTPAKASSPPPDWARG